MEKSPKELLKAYVDSQKFNSTSQIVGSATTRATISWKLL